MSVAVHDAKIQTLSVQIREILVSNRKMTKSIFRQIPEEPILWYEDEDSPLKGIPWGHINYYWDGCSSSYWPSGDDIRHLLWQKDCELRRWWTWQTIEGTLITGTACEGRRRRCLMPGEAE